ncbi:MAG: hypothetical protein ACKO3W_09840 [bacterium]
MANDDNSYTIQRIRPKREGGGTAPLGTVAELVQIFSRINTAPDRPGSIELFGPGMLVRFIVEGGAQAARPSDVVASIDLHVLERELFEVMFLGTPFEKPGRLATTVRANGWTLVNTETGHSFPQQRDDDEDDEDEADDERDSSSRNTSADTSADTSDREPA